MSAWTRDELLQQIAATKSAIHAATTSASYGIEGRSLTRQRLEALRAHFAYLENELAILDGKIGRGPHFVTVRPRR